MVQGLSPVTTPLRLVLLTWTKIVSPGSVLAISGNPRLFLLLSWGDFVNSPDSPELRDRLPTAAKIYKSAFSRKRTLQSLGMNIIFLDVTLASKFHRKNVKSAGIASAQFVSHFLCNQITTWCFSQLKRKKMVTVHDLALSKNNPLYGFLCRGPIRGAVAIRLSLIAHKLTGNAFLTLSLPWVPIGTYRFYSV